MWKRLCCVPVTLERDDSRRTLHFRVDYRRQEGNLELSFQIGELVEGRWKRKDRFDDEEFYIIHNGTRGLHHLLADLRQEGLLEDPESAQRFVDHVVEEAERENEERKRTVGAKSAFLQLMMNLFGAPLEGLDPDVVADVDPDPIPLLPE